MKKLVLCSVIVFSSGLVLAQKDIAAPGSNMQQVGSHRGNLRELPAAGSQQHNNAGTAYRAGSSQTSFSKTGSNTQLSPVAMEKYVAKPLSGEANLDKNGNVRTVTVDHTGNPVANTPVSSHTIKRKMDDLGTGIITVDFGTLTKDQKTEIYFPYNPVTLSNTEDMATQPITIKQFVRYINLSGSKAITNVALGSGKQLRDGHTGPKNYNGFLVHFDAAKAAAGVVDELVQVETTSGSLRLRLKGNVLQ
jgi:hypothetical protein